MLEIIYITIILCRQVVYENGLRHAIARSFKVPVAKVDCS